MLDEGTLCLLTHAACSDAVRTPGGSVIGRRQYDDRTRAHFARRLSVDAAELTDQAFLDAVSEAGNMVCGTLNRELGRVFPHIGMSTPHMLDRECLLHVGRLRFGHQSHLRLTLAGDASFHATLYVSDYAAIDFDAPAEEHTAASGELEMF